MDVVSLVTALFTGGAFVIYGVQAWLMRKTMIVSNRAYINIGEIIAIPLREDSEGPITFWRFAPKVENAGNTPIFRGVMTTYSLISDMKLDDQTFTYPAASIYPKIWVSPISLGPKAMVPGTKFDISVETLFEIGERKKWLYMWGWVDYSDRFSGRRRRRTEFAREVVVRAYARDEAARPFRMPYLWHHNGADEDSFRHPVKYEAALRGEIGPIRKQYRQKASKPQ